MNQLKHVAIIMDGNGRWGLKKKKSRNYGHNAGLNTVEKVIKSSIKQKIPPCSFLIQDGSRQEELRKLYIFKHFIEPIM